MSSRTNSWLAFAAVLLGAIGAGAGGAAADTAPHPVVLGLLSPQPADHAPAVVRKSTFSKEETPLPDAPGGVSLQRLRTEIDLYPTFAIVDTSCELRGGAATEELELSLPEATMGTFSAALLGIFSEPVAPTWETRQVAAFPYEDLTVRVNGQPIEPALISDPRPRWSWRITVPAGSELRVELRYLSAMYHSMQSNERGVTFATANLPRSASLWRGPVDEISLIVRPHWIDAARVEASVEPQTRNEREIGWRFAQLEPTTDFYFWFTLSRAEIERMAFGDSPYPLAAVPPRWALVDRLVRIVRSDNLARPVDHAPLADELVVRHGRELHAALLAAVDSADADLSDYAQTVLWKLHPPCTDDIFETERALVPLDSIDRDPGARFHRGLEYLLLDRWGEHSPLVLVTRACEQTFERRRRIKLVGGAALAAAAVTCAFVLFRRWRKRRRAKS